MRAQTIPHVTDPLKPRTLSQAWRQGIEVGDIVTLHHIPSGKRIVVQVTRATVRMVCFWIAGRYMKGFRVKTPRELRIMRRDGLNYGRPKHWELERAK